MTSSRIVLSMAALLLAAPVMAQDAGLDAGLAEDGSLQLDGSPMLDSGVQDAGDGDAGEADAAWLDASQPDAACVDVDALGECQGVVVRSCINGLVHETDCVREFGNGFTCVLSAQAGAAQCVFVTRDAGLDSVDAGPDVVDAGPVAINPPASSGCTCLRVTPGDVGLVLGAALWMRPRRRREQSRR